MVLILTASVVLSKRSARVGHWLDDAPESQKIEESGRDPAPTVPGAPEIVTTTESPMTGDVVLTEIEVTLLAAAAKTRVTFVKSYLQ